MIRSTLITHRSSPSRSPLVGSDDDHVVAAHVEKPGHHDSPALEVPDFSLGHGEEALGLDHIVGKTGARHQLDFTLDAVKARQDHYTLAVSVICHGLLSSRITP